MALALALVALPPALLLSPMSAPRFAAGRHTVAPRMALDYKDPVVAAEMAEIQKLSPDEVCALRRR